MSSSMRASPAGGAAGVPEALSESLVELSLGQSAAGAQLNVDVAGSLLRHAVLKDDPKSHMSEYERIEQEDEEAARDHKTRFCRHPRSCLSSACGGVVRGFTLAFGAKAGLSLLSSIVFGKFHRSPLQSILSACGPDNRRFAFFISMYLGGFRAMHCIMRRYRCKEDGWNAFGAGLVAGLSSFIETKANRKAYALFLLVRSLAFLATLLQERGYIPDMKNGDVLVFCLVCCEIMYVWHLHPDALHRAYHSWISHKGGIDWRILMGSRAIIRGEAPKEFLDSWCTEKGIPLLPSNDLDMVPCSVMHPGFDSCTKFAMYRWPMGIPLCLPVYAPVHTVPLLLFRWRQLMKDPKTTLKKLAIRIARSTLFLSTFPVIFWITFCKMRQLMGRESRVTTAVAGFMSGLSLLFEKDTRRGELILFCIPKTLESLWTVLKTNGWQSQPWGTPLFFCFASGLLMNLYHHHAESISRPYLLALKQFLRVH